MAKVQQSLIQRAVLLPAAKHRLYLGIDAVDAAWDAQASLATWDEASWQLLQENAMAEQGYDQIISPCLVLNHAHVQTAIQRAGALLPQGGWWLFATIVDGSFAQVVAQMQDLQVNTPFQTIHGLLQALSSERCRHPVIDCERYHLHYTDAQVLYADFASLVAHTTVLNENALQAQLSTAEPMLLEIAFVAVQISAQVRASMRPIHQVSVATSSG